MSKKVNQAEARRKRITIALWVSFFVVIAIVFVVLAKVASKSPASSGGTTVASDALMAKVTGIPASVLNSVGTGDVSTLPKGISAPALTKDGKPHVVYIGAEYCPYCAAERWAMVIALSRFGQFKNLGQTNSASQDVYPSTPTFSFHGATYTSKYLVFNGVETSSNQPEGSGYAPLDTLTSEQQTLMSTYDAAPYVSASAAGSIPFVDFGGKYLISGASFDPAVLQGKTADQIASALSDSSSPIAKSVVGAANAMTAAICKLTANQPANVCTPAIKSIQVKL